VKPSEKKLCQVSNKEYSLKDLVMLEGVRPKLAEMILEKYPNLNLQSYISVNELNKFRLEYVKNILESDVGEISILESEVIKSIKEHELLTENINKEFETQLTFGEKLADNIATFGGSWKFIILFTCFLLLWITINIVVLTTRPIDPYPFILLNLLLSCLAAMQAPFIMMSQNRQQEKDRLRAEHEYKVSLKSELEIRQLHEKVDHLLKHQSQRLFDIQQMQLELLQDLTRLSGKK
jgi:uncharacterized membrane protein